MEATTLEGANYSIKVGKLAGENHYVSFSASGLKPDAKDAERVKVLSQHVLLIPKSKLEDTIKQRASFSKSRTKRSNRPEQLDSRRGVRPPRPGDRGVIQLAIAPVFMLTAVGTVIGALNVRLGARSTGAASWRSGSRACRRPNSLPRTKSSQRLRGASASFTFRSYSP